jgi:hypothetical protein
VHAKLTAFLWAGVNIALGDIPIDAFDKDPVFSDLAYSIS